MKRMLIRSLSENEKEVVTIQRKFEAIKRLNRVEIIALYYPIIALIR